MIDHTHYGRFLVTPPYARFRWKVAQRRLYRSVPFVTIGYSPPNPLGPQT